MAGDNAVRSLLEKMIQHVNNAYLGILERYAHHINKAYLVHSTCDAPHFGI